MDLSERLQEMLEEAEEGIEMSIPFGDNDFIFWRGYRDAVNAVIRFLEEP